MAEVLEEKRRRRRKGGFALDSGGGVSHRGQGLHLKGSVKRG